MICMQYQLLIQMTFSIEKPGEFNHAVNLKPGNSQSQLSQCNRKNIQYNLPDDTRFFLPGYVIDCKLNYGNTSRCIAQNTQFNNFSTNNCLITFQLRYSLCRSAGFFWNVFRFINGCIRSMQACGSGSFLLAHHRRWLCDRTIHSNG